LAAAAVLVAGCASVGSPSASPGGTPGASTGGTPAASTGGSGEQVTLTIESWRSEDRAIWTDKIIPAFNAKYPNIKISFLGTLSTEYDPTLASRLKAGSAGDLITCRPFDTSLNLFQGGYLAPLNDLAGIDNFPESAKVAWQTDDGKTIFCVPMASVIHGFFYNKAIFAKLNLQVPATWADFLALLETIKKDGKYAPLVMGIKDQWPAALNLFDSIGPGYYKGETGRKALIAGTLKFTDQPFVDTMNAMTQLIPYLESGYQGVGDTDALKYFELAKAAIEPHGSWNIGEFYGALKDDLGFFPPPVPKAGDQCYLEDHVDIALGMNAKTAHPKEVRTFLEWVATPEFAALYSNALPGFFPLSSAPVTLDNPVAQEVVDARKTCQSTIRPAYQILSRGQPNLETDLWTMSAAVMTKTMTPVQALQKIQQDLDSWYKPAK
jgi:raffinose/stachyose/melibiose transport system substrate-binding protein